MGRRRLAFDELFFLQLGMALKRQGVKVTPGIAFDVSEARLEAAKKLGAGARVVSVPMTSSASTPSRCRASSCPSDALTARAPKPSTTFAAPLSTTFPAAFTSIITEAAFRTVSGTTT